MSQKQLSSATNIVIATKLKVGKFQKANYGFKTSSKKQIKLTILEDYYLKVNTKRESMFFLQEDRLSFVLTLK